MSETRSPPTLSPEPCPPWLPMYTLRRIDTPPVPRPVPIPGQPPLRLHQNPAGASWSPVFSRHRCGRSAIRGIRLCMGAARRRGTGERCRTFTITHTAPLVGVMLGSQVRGRTVRAGSTTLNRFHSTDQPGFLNPFLLAAVQQIINMFALRTAARVTPREYLSPSNAALRAEPPCRPLALCLEF